MTYTLDKMLNQYLCVISSISPSFKQNPPHHAINRTMTKTAESRETPKAVLLAEKMFYYLYPQFSPQQGSHNRDIFSYTIGLKKYGSQAGGKHLVRKKKKKKTYDKFPKLLCLHECDTPQEFQNRVNDARQAAKS